MKIGPHIERARRSKGWSQRQLAEAIGVPQSRVSQIERDDGYPTIPQLIAIREATGANFDELLLGGKAVEPKPGLTHDQVEILRIIDVLNLDYRTVVRALTSASHLRSWPEYSRLLLEPDKHSNKEEYFDALWTVLPDDVKHRYVSQQDLWDHINGRADKTDPDDDSKFDL